MKTPQDDQPRTNDPDGTGLTSDTRRRPPPTVPHPARPDAAPPGRIAPAPRSATEAFPERQHVPTIRPPGARRTRPWLRPGWLIFGLVLLLVIGGLGLGGWLYARSATQGMKRVDAFSQVPEAERPAKAASKALNLLILGRDSRDPDAPDARTDSIMLLHLPASRDRAQLISIPRDTWVAVPKSADGRRGGRKAKINAAYAWGGAPLMVRTVESFTGVRLDHVLLIDFSGFERIVDAVGGVEITVDTAFASIHPPFRKFPAGRQRLNGAAALDYARQRKQFRDGDFARIRHQQQLIAAIVEQAARSGVLTNPVRLNAVLRATADAVTIDRTLSMFELAWEMRTVRSKQLTRLISPTSRSGKEGDQSVVYPDTGKARRLYQAVKDDTMEKWLSRNRPR